MPCSTLAYFNIWDFQVSQRSVSGIIGFPLKVNTHCFLLPCSDPSVYQCSHPLVSSQGSDSCSSLGPWAFSSYLLIRYFIHWPIHSFCQSVHYLICLIPSHPFSSYRWKRLVFCLTFFWCSIAVPLDFVSFDVSRSQSRYPFVRLKYAFLLVF